MSKAAPSSPAKAAPAAAPVAPAAAGVVPVPAESRKNVELAISSITKQFGEGSIMRLGENTKMKVETLSTGSLAIDLCLGEGPR